MPACGGPVPTAERTMEPAGHSVTSHKGLASHPAIRERHLHVVAFVQATSGETVWYLCSGLSKPLFEALLAGFARKVGAGRERHIVLVLDNAGWHGPEGLSVPEGVSL